MKLVPVIMSGGSGTRLWPVSRSKFPKQFCELLESPLQSMTLRRLQKFGPALIVTSQQLKSLTESDVHKNHFQIEKVLYEPQARNTAPAIALVCRYMQLQNRVDEVVGVFSSDHLVQKEAVFLEALETGARAAADGAIVTLGIKPTRPETGYGYIQVQPVSDQDAKDVLKFHEKPSLEKAESFIQAGTYFWNAGMFLFKVSRMIELFQKHEPEIWNQMLLLQDDLKNIDFVYENLKSISIDYAILEKLSATELKCVTCDIGWSDIGSWDALAEIDKGFLSVSADQNLIQVDGAGNSVVPYGDKNYSVVGLDDMIVVDTADALLICKKGSSQKVKDVVELVKKTQPKLAEEHVFENRPWGRFEVLKDQSYYKSKVIRVDAGQKISYQSHAQRSEHWILVKGEAVVVLNDQHIPLKTGEHIYIPQGAKHRIQNPTSSAIEFVEVQVGTYFGEDDIVRYQDDYGRNHE